MTFRAAILGLLLLPLGSAGALAPFLEKHCVECHDADTKKGGLDMTAPEAGHPGPEVLRRLGQDP